MVFVANVKAMRSSKDVNKQVIIFVIFAFALLNTQAQNLITITGKITDINNSPLIGANIIVDNSSIITATNSKGIFIITDAIKGKNNITVKYIGYKTFSKNYYVTNDTTLHIMLQFDVLELSEISIKDKMLIELKQNDSRNIEIVDNTFLRQNISGSLMQSLSRLPGVTSIDIGSGQSKPVIRGLGFNRVVVAENGIVHQGQEWGADHGLEL